MNRYPHPTRHLRFPGRRGLLAFGALLLLLTACTLRTGGPTPDTTKVRPTAAHLPTADRSASRLGPAETSSSPEASPTSTVRVTSTPRPHPPAEAEAGDSWESPVDGMTLLFLPADDFPMGTLAEFRGGQPDEEPQHRVQLDAYWIDQTEVTRAMYDRCVQEGGCTGTPAEAEGDGADHPVTGIPWEAARAYCSWAGRRLPTEAEWERAARGEDGRRYPWGWIGSPESPRGLHLNYCDANCPFDYADPNVDDGFAQTAPVGTYPQGASPVGALDMAGNVWEWTADWYAVDYYRQSPAENPTGPSEGRWRVMRGGSWVESIWEGLVLSSRASNRAYLNPSRGQPDVGFRCAVSAPANQDSP